jgi:hypothetical protein
MPRPADYAWSTLAALIVAYEASSPPGELLSEACDRYRRRHPIATDLTIVYIAAHLMRRWPRPIDPLHRLATRLGR